MKTHPYLRAYMAGIAVPTPFLLVAVTGFTIGRSIYLDYYGIVVWDYLPTSGASGTCCGWP